MKLFQEVVCLCPTRSQIIVTLLLADDPVGPTDDRPTRSQSTSPRFTEFAGSAATGDAAAAAPLINCYFLQTNNDHDGKSCIISPSTSNHSKGYFSCEMLDVLLLSPMSRIVMAHQRVHDQ